MSALAIPAELILDDKNSFDAEYSSLPVAASGHCLGTGSHMKNHVGMVVDRFWEIIPKGHRAHKISPRNMPLPHEHFLALGKEVIKACHEQGHHFEDRLTKDVDCDAWTRLLGAWVYYAKQRIETHGGMPARFAIAREMGLDASSLTNFLNARRPITLKALKIMAQFLGVKPLDIRPEMGASDLYAQDRKIKKSMISLRSGLETVLRDIQRIQEGGNYDELNPVMDKLKLLKESVAI